MNIKVGSSIIVNKDYSSITFSLKKGDKVNVLDVKNDKVYIQKLYYNHYFSPSMFRWISKDYF
jgi:hypothetical protein